MDRLPKFFMKRPTLFWSLMVGILIMGVLSYAKMPKLEDPAVPIKQASVICLYPGADVTTMELDVAAPMEDALRTLPNIRRLKTDVSPGKVMIGVEFEMEVPSEELEQRFDIVRRKMNDLVPRLPSGCMAPIVIDDMMDVYGLLYAFTGDGYSLKELENYAKELRRELLSVKGVKRVNIGGTRAEVINIDFTPEYIKANGMLPTQLMLSLQGATQAVDAGKLPTGERRMTMEVTDAVKTVDDVANLLINTPDGKKVRLGDIAKVTRSYQEPHTNAIYVNGESALTLAIALQADAIVPDVGKLVDAKMQETLARFPAGMQSEKIFFQPDKVDDAMHGFLLNLLESVVIVVIVLMLSMGWRSGLIIGFGLVLTVALSFPILSALDTTLQRISLGAFIVAMGMLVDNAVVIMDGILIDRDKGLPEDKYLFRIGKNTALPLLGATVIAACTFLPIYLTPGTAGEFAGDLFIVICVSLLASWVLALVQVPMCAKAWLGSHTKKEVAELEKKYPEGPVYRFIHTLLRWLLGHRFISFAAAVAILVAAGAGAAKMRNVFFPDFDYKQFVAECYFPASDDANVVNARIRALADSVSALPDVERVIVSTGTAPARYCFVRPMPSGGDNYAELIIDCKDFNAMQKASRDVITDMRRMAPDAYIRSRKYNFSIGSTHTVEVEFAGPDPAVLRRLSEEAEDVMRRCQLIDPYSVQNNWHPRAAQLQFAFSQQDAQRAGVSRSDVGNALQAAGEGYPVGVIYEGDNILPVKLRVRRTDGSRVEPLTSAPVWAMANVNVDPNDLQGLMTGTADIAEIQRKMYSTTLLGNVVDSASVRYTDDYVYRYKGQRAIQAECDPDPYNPDATPAKVVAAITPAIEAIQLPPGYSMRWVGEGETSQEATGLVIGFMPMIIMIVLAVLLLLFNDWRKLFVIVLCFPFVLCGIVPMLLITNTPFTFIAILGFMGLIGMMVKNAIVLVDEITRLQTEAQVEAYEAVVRASLSRVRPVMLASFTTILGMIPLISDAMYGSLAVTVIGGLFVGTIVTLLILPLLYSLFFKVKRP